MKMKIFKELVKLKMWSLGLGPDPIGPGSLYEEAIGTYRHTQGQPRGDTEQTAVNTPRREVSGGTSPVHTWVLNVQLLG